MKNKILFLIISLLLIPELVLAKDTCNDNDIKIKSITLKELNGFSEEIQESSINNNTISLNLKMYDVGDSSTYDITVENTSDEDYYFTKDSMKLENDYLEYSLKNDSELIPAKEEKTIELKVSYKNKIPSESYSDTSKLIISLSDKPLENPKTKMTYTFILMLISLIMITIFIKMNNKPFNKKKLFLIGTLLSIIPLTTTALCTVNLNVETKIEIDEKVAGYLYNVLESEATTNGLALEYTGEHQDSLANVGNKKIYHWYAENDNEGEEVINKNNVIFAGFCWQMIRTTDTGGVKMIYNGISNEGKCNNEGEAQQVSNSSFNLDTLSPASSGYMYDSENILLSKYVESRENTLYGSDVTYNNGEYTLVNTSTSFDNNHHYTCNNDSGICSTVIYYFYDYKNRNKDNNYDYYYFEISDGRNIQESLNDMLFKDNVNKQDSIIKKAVDEWYHDNMQKYTEKLEDTIFCNNRTIKSLGGWNPNGGKSTDPFLFFNFPLSNTLACPNLTDQFSVSNEKAKLTYPVGLISGEEMNLLNNNIIRKTGVQYWLSTPGSYSYASMMSRVAENGRVSIYTSVNAKKGVRPAISLKDGTGYLRGNGSKDNPYIAK